jgi:hypothetical protein
VTCHRGALMLGRPWSTRVLRYMATHDEPRTHRHGHLVQPLVSARVSGGGLSRTAETGMVLNAT